VVEFAEQFLGVAFEDFEIDAEAGRIQFPGTDSDLDIPVVAVQIFAVTLVVDQAVGRCKVRLDSKVIHEVYDSNILFLNNIIFMFIVT